MALTLDLSYQEQNDNLALVITDIAGTYNAVDNPLGWGDPNPAAGFAFSDIVISTDVLNAGHEYHLLLTVIFTDSDGTETNYDTINLRDHNAGDFIDASDFVFTINASHLSASGIAMGTAVDTMTDGLYAVTYTLVDNDDHDLTNGVATTGNYIVSETILIDGVVRVEIYDKLRQIPISYICSDCCESNTIKEATFMYSYLIGMESGAYNAKTEEIYAQLNVLENMIANGSNCTW